MSALAKVVVWVFRLAQLAIGIVALALVYGAFAANVSVIAAVLVFGLVGVMLLGVLVFEVPIRAIQRRVA